MTYTALGQVESITRHCTPMPVIAVESSVIAPESSVIATESSVIAPESSVIAPESSVIAPESSVIAPESSVIAASEPQSASITYTYYPGGKLKSVSLPFGETETYEYDKNGNIKTVTDALGNKTALTYDSLDRVVQTTNPLGHSKHFVYDAAGNITHITDENGNTTQYKYSPLGDVAEVIDATGHSTKYSYDAMKRLTELTQYNALGEPQITTYERNKKGEVVAVTSPLATTCHSDAQRCHSGLDPESCTVRYTYDKVGRVTSKVDEDSLETLYSYNLANQLSTISYADGKTVAFEYNALRQLTQMRDWLGTTTIELDQLGRATKVTDHSGNEVGYAWNALGQREKLIYPDGKEVRYEYTPSGKLSTVIAYDFSPVIASEREAIHTTSYTYDPLGRISQRILPDNTTTKYEFNQLGALTSLTHSNAGNILDQFNYSHDPAGNITHIEKHRTGIDTDNGVFKYAYDPLNRLIEATNGAGGSKQYSYDPLGNRTSVIATTPSVIASDAKQSTITNHVYNARNQLVKTTEGDTETNYTYDFRGNLTHVTENGQLKHSYTFDATNMMVGAFASDKGTAEYSYNGFRNRVAKLEQYANTPVTANPSSVIATPSSVIASPSSVIASASQRGGKQSSTLNYVLDITRPYDNLLMTQGGSQDQSFIWGNSLLSATGEDNFHYLQDHLGSPIRLVNDNNHSDILSYDEFGVPDTVAGFAQAQPFGFTGYQLDDISGLYYAQARFYNPTIGRFGAEDPIKNKINWYGYCGGNPITFIDPSGLAEILPCVCETPGCPFGCRF